MSAVSDEDSMNAMSNVKQEASLAESAMSVMTTDTQAAVTSEEEPMTTVSVPFVSQSFLHPESNNLISVTQLYSWLLLSGLSLDISIRFIITMLHYDIMH